jgi:hypothetical protein
MAAAAARSVRETINYCSKSLSAESKLLVYGFIFLILAWLMIVAVQIWWIFVVLACYRYVRDKAAAMTSLPQHIAQYTLVLPSALPYEEAAPIEAKVCK